MECRVDKNTIRKGIINAAAKMLDDSNLFVRDSQLSTAEVPANAITNNSSIDIKPEYPNYEQFRAKVFDGDKEIGVMHLRNDGEYLTPFSVEIKSLQPNSGTHAHMRAADLASSMGLMMASDLLSTRMSEASTRTWERFVKAGQAQKMGDRYIFEGTSQAVADYYEMQRENTFVPKDPQSNWREVVNMVNQEFGETILYELNPDNHAQVIIPSSSLINSYENTYRSQEETYDSYVPSEEDYIEFVKNLKQLGISQNTTVDEYIKKNMQDMASDIAKLRKANPTVKMYFDEGSSAYLPKYNSIRIDLDEIFDTSRATNTPLKQVLDNIILHELTHAATALAIRIPDNMKQVTELYKVALEHHGKNPFVDNMRAGYVTSEGRPYSLKNLDEFLADAYSNPYFQEWLKTIELPSKKSLWQQLIDSILEFFGITKPMLYDRVVNFITSERIAIENRERVNRPSAEWAPSMQFNGMPRNYTEAAFELFTSETVKDEVESVIKKLTPAIIKIKNSLKDETDKVKVKSLQRLLDAYNDVRDNQNSVVVSINMITQAAVIARDIGQQMAQIKKLPDDGRKIALAYSLMQNAKSLSFIDNLAQDLLRIVEREGRDIRYIDRFAEQLRGIISVSASANRAFIDVLGDPLIETLSNFVGESQAEKDIKARIAQLQAEKTKEPNPEVRKIYDHRINMEEKELGLIPNRENFKQILAGNYRDASPLQLNFEAAIMNDHPLVNTAANIIRTMNIRIGQLMLPVANKHQAALDQLKKAVGKDFIRKTDDFYNPIMDYAERVDEVEEDEQGNIKFTYTKQKMLLSSYSPEFIKQASEKTALRDYYLRKLSEADRLGNDEQAKKYGEQLERANKDRRQFYRENTEGKFTDEVLEMYDLLEREVIKDDGTPTTFSRERGYIFDRIEELERQRDEEIVPEVQDKIQEQIRESYIALASLKSKYNDDGSEKTGFELQLSNIANEYSELKNKYGRYELTDTGKAIFEKEVLRLDYLKTQGRISPEEFDRRLGDITVTELSPAYYDTLRTYAQRVDELTAQISQIPEFKSMFTGVDKEKIKQGYDKIKDLVRPFRDNEMTIDGTLFSKVRPELVIEIKNIQQQTEDLKAIASKLSGLSIDDSLRFTTLNRKRKAKTITEEEKQEFTALQEKNKVSKETYNKYKDLLDEYREALADLASLNESKPSTYYDREVERQRSIYVKQKEVEVRAQIATATSLLGGKYFKLNGRWVEVTRVEGDSKIFKEIDLNGLDTTEEAVIHRVAKQMGEDELRNTEWWANNHFDKYVWSRKDNTYTAIQTPIYIWVKTEPEDKSLILSRQPSIKFKTYRVHPQYYNDRYGYLNDGIPKPKPGKFPNKRYEDLRVSTSPADKAYYKYLEFIREDYRGAQEHLNDNKRMGDILPSFIKTGDELKVETTDSLRGKAANVIKGNIKEAFRKTSDPDEQLLSRGSTTDFFAKNQIIPTRFAGRMDAEKQSSDIAAMLLGFNLAHLQYNEMAKAQPLLEALRTQSENVDVTETKKLARKFSISNIFSGVKAETKTSKKNVDETVLAKSVNHVIDTFFYGVTKNEASVNFLGGEVDLNKVSSGLKTVSSKAIFAFNMFSAVKNTLAGTIQANINANISKGFYTKLQYEKSKAEAVIHARQFLSDYQKFGNKSKIGQELDFFQVLQGVGYNSYGQKTAWTALKSAGDFITAFKNISEFELQVSQYLAMSKANPVKVGDKWVEFREAFEIKDGTLVPVQGAEITQPEIDRFMGRLSYVNRIINGAYRAEERNALQKNVLGDLAFYLNGYLIPGITNRYAKTRYSAETDMITKGYHAQMLSLLGDLYKYRKNMAKVWQTLSPDEKARVHRSLLELSVVIAFGLLMLVMGGGDDKKELMKNSSFYNMTLALALATKSETETFIPLPSMGLNELSRKMNSPFAALKQVTNSIRVMQNLSDWVVQNEDAYYKRKTLDDGFHDKGDPKFVASLARLVGWSGTGWDPLQKALQVERMQQIR